MVLQQARFLGQRASRKPMFVQGVGQQEPPRSDQFCARVNLEPAVDQNPHRLANRLSGRLSGRLPDLRPVTFGQITNGKLRVIIANGADTRQDRAGPGAPGMPIRACGRTGDPLATPIGQGRSAIQTRGNLEPNPWQTPGHS